LLRSLRLRLLLLALTATCVALVLAGAVISELFSRHLERRIEQELDAYLAQIAGAVDVDANGRLTVVRQPANPRFAAIYGGLYWQVRDEGTGATLRSRSLWDVELAAADTSAPADATSTAEVQGPSDQVLHIRERRITISAGDQARAARISVGVTREDQERLKSAFTKDMVLALGVLGAFLMLAAWFQVSAGLQPLKAVRRGVQAVQAGQSRRLEEGGLSELQPLVSAVNTLLAEQETALIRARDRAADLAHGLKTPLTALAADVRLLRERGDAEIAAGIGAVGDQMRRTVERELARSRMRHAQVQERAPVRPIADALARTLARTPAGASLHIGIEVDDLCAVWMDQDDLYDVLGNLMENAARHADTRLVVAAEVKHGRVGITVHDDGAGLEPGVFARLTERGLRQDQSGGAGLGLAIVSEILQAYGSALRMEPSALGGLSVSFDVAGEALRAPVG
jgi:signal transduction histidine kinase